MCEINFRTIIGINCIVLLFVFACDIQKGAENGDQIESHYIEPSDANPVEHALSLLDLNHAKMIRPLWHEAGYHLIARNPLIDHVAASPFYLHDWADKSSLQLQKNAAKSLTDILAFMMLTLNGGFNYTNQLEPVKSVDNFTDAYGYLWKQHGSIPDEQRLNLIQRIGFSKKFDLQLGQLVVALADASILVGQAYAALTPEELDYLGSRPERFFFPFSKQFDFLTEPTHVQYKIVSVTRKIDFRRLFVATLVMSEAIDRFVSYISSLDDPADASHYFTDNRGPQGLVLDIPTPAGNIVIFGQGDNVYADSGMLVIDLGGDDHYSGPIAAGHLMPGRVSLAIDISGNDVYDAGKKAFSQGFGSMAVGMLVDLAGDDRYHAGDMSQGSGIYGVGLIVDGEGNDVYSLGMLGQGIGVFGIGLLVDKRGDDRYMIGGLGQGAGSTMGIGALVDVDGNDKYLAQRNAKQGNLIGDEWNHVQGAGLSIRSPEWTKQFSLYGGIGFLSDGAGDDVYFSSHGNCMGSSYFMSIGALVDHFGNDKYFPKGGSGLGFAVHLSNAVIIDRDGNDYYFGNTQTGGVGSDRSVALMVDYEGNDVYGPTTDFARKETETELRRQNLKASQTEMNQNIQEKLADASYGSAHKPRALGVLIDYKGNDHYFARQDGWGESFGGVVPPVNPLDWSHAIHLDLSGNDFYVKDAKKDNTYVKYFDHGLCYDTEYRGNEIIAKQPLSPAMRTAFQIEKLPISLETSPIYMELRDLLEPDLFSRYAAVGKIIAKGPAILPDLISVLSVSENNELNRDLIEILITFIINRHMKPKHSEDFAALLWAKDPLVQKFAALTFGWHQVKSSVPFLIQALEETTKQMRSHIIWALGRIDSPEAMDAIIDKGFSEPDVSCRRAAYIALENHLRQFKPIGVAQKVKLIERLQIGLEDSDEVVRLYAATALQAFGDNPEIMRALMNRLQDVNVYVQRAAATSVILNGSTEGIPVLIETLKYPSIDTFEHYDHELAKDLAFYTGIDFSEEKRYAYATWHDWWRQNSSRLNLKQNLVIMEKITEAFEAAKEEEGIAIFEALMMANPDNVVVKNRFKRFCYEWITFRLLTREEITEDILKRCLRLQKIKTKLDTADAGGFSSLAYFHARLREYEKAVAAIQVAIKLNPKNVEYQDTLKKYVYLKQSTGE
jgi:tetratricopeptide (TPR) repeat protein